MRKSLIVIGLLILIGAGVLLQASEEKKDLADFEITVTVTKEGIALESDHGCAWVEASYEGSGDSYSVTIDEYGVKGTN